jgi:hypothetical protein
VATYWDKRTHSDKREKPSGRLTLILLGVFVVGCIIAALFIGDLAKLQEPVFARESLAALQGVDDQQALDQVLQKHSSNRILRLIALAKKDAVETDGAARKLLDEADPAALAKSANLTAASRADLDALRGNLKIAEGNAAAFKPRIIALVKARRDETEREARLLGAGSDALAKFMAVIDAQHADIMAHIVKMSAARAERNTAYDKCAALLVKEFGTYKVTNGQFIFRAQSTADSYNAAAVAMAAAAKRIAELDDESAGLRQSQLKRWKEFAGS